MTSALPNRILSLPGKGLDPESLWGTRAFLPPQVRLLAENQKLQACDFKTASRTQKEEVVKERVRVLVQVKLQVRRSANTSLLAVAANDFLTFQPSLDRPAQTESFGLSRAGFMHKLLHFRNFSRIRDAYPYKCVAEVQAPFPMLWHKPAMKICRHKPICRCGH